MKKIFILFLILLILFPLNLFHISAEGVSGGSCSTYFVNGLDGKKYCMPQSLIGTPYEQRYKNVVESGNLNENDREVFLKVAENFNNQNLYTKFKNFLDFTFSPTGVKNGEGVKNCLFNFHHKVNSFLELGCDSYTSKGSDLYKPGLYNQRDTGVRNYYNGLKNTTTNNQNNTTTNYYYVGDTTTYSIVNDFSKTITYYNTTTNNYVTNHYKNYHYNIYDYKYTYNIDDHTTYQITNNIDNTSVVILNDSGVVENKFYFELPDGSNSYNMTEKDIQGFQLDFNVKNYDNISDSNNLLGLFHFENDLTNSSFNTSSNLELTLPSINYLNDSNTHFNGYIMLGAGDGNINFNSSNVKTFDFRFKPIFTKNFNLKIGESIFDRHIVNKSETTYEKKNVVTEVIESYTGKYATCPAGTSRHSSSGTWGNDNYSVSCKRQITKVETVPVVNNYTVDEQNDLSKLLFYNAWNHIAFSNVVDGVGDLFVNGNLIKSGVRVFDGNKILISYNFDGSMGFDELRVSSKNLYTDNFSPSVMPYDTDLTYILPDVEKNNTILIQSRLKVNRVQFGGKRNSSPVLGDVYVSVNDDYIITSLQQFNGSDWININSSIYNTYKNKWVELVGYSVKKGQETFNPGQESPGFGSGGVSESFLEKWFNVFVEIFKNFTPNKIFKEAGTNFWDFLIEIVKAIPETIGKLGEAFIGLFGTAANFIKWLFDKLVYLLIPSQEFWENLQLPNFKANLGILFVPFELMGNLISKLFDFNKINNSSFVLDWQDIKLYDVVLINSGNFNAIDFINSNSNFRNIYNIYLTVIDGIVYFGLLNLIRLKGLSFLKR